MLRTTGDEVLDLVAAVYRQAVDDARAGRKSAQAWLDDEYPEWRDLMRPRKPRKATATQAINSLQRE